MAWVLGTKSYNPESKRLGGEHGCIFRTMRGEGIQRLQCAFMVRVVKVYVSTDTTLQEPRLTVELLDCKSV
jgi:hypothetical protein